MVRLIIFDAIFWKWSFKLWPNFSCGFWGIKNLFIQESRQEKWCKLVRYSCFDVGSPYNLCHFWKRSSGRIHCIWPVKTHLTSNICVVLWRHLSWSTLSLLLFLNGSFFSLPWLIWPFFLAVQDWFLLSDHNCFQNLSEGGVALSACSYSSNVTADIPIYGGTKILSLPI